MTDEIEALAPAALADRIERGETVTLVDTRDREAVDRWAIDGPDVERVHVPYVEFVAARARGEPAAPLEELGEPVVVVCARGEASDEVAAQLRGAGVDARNLAGGMAGWARVYRATELAADAGGATVTGYRRPATGCLAYLVVADGEALVVDPLRAFADRYAADASATDARLTAAVDTHVHADHLSGLRAVADEGATACMSAAAAERAGLSAVRTVADGDELSVGSVAVEVVAAPGHTAGGIALAVGDLLVCGDTLFVDGVARPDLEAGEEAAAYARELHRTLTERFARFGDDTVVAPGHHGPRAARAADGSYTARLGDLRDRLWAFDADREAFVERVLDGLGPRPANDERIVAVNCGRETVDDATAFELELGPNNCAVEA